MDNKRKSILFIALGGVAAGSVAPIAAHQPVLPIFLIVPLILMGIFLLLAGYYAGLARGGR